MSAQAIRMGIAVAVVVVVTAAGLAIAAYATHVPDDAASQPLAAVVVPEQGRAPDASMFPAAPAGGESAVPVGDIMLEQSCMTPLAKSAGSLSACWQVSRHADADADADYFRLRLYGTLTAPQWPNGLRWIVVRLTPIDGTTEMDAADAHAPAGQSGPSPTPGNEGPLAACGGWTKAEDATGGFDATWRVGWRCPFGAAGGSLDLSTIVQVPEGGAASWIVFADFGT